MPLGTYEVTVGSEVKQVSPSCALSDYTGEPYSFYIKPGKKDKLVLYTNGGGACWNGATCNPASGVYVPTTTAANDPREMDGLLNVENPNNPYKDWTMVFMSYCTGDVFLGSKDTVYQNPNPTQAFPLPVFTIHHRGHDNFLYVMKYVQDHLVDPKVPIGKVVVAGSSAGSYGASLNFP